MRGEEKGKVCGFLKVQCDSFPHSGVIEAVGVCVLRVCDWLCIMMSVRGWWSVDMQSTMPP